MVQLGGQSVVVLNFHEGLYNRSTNHLKYVYIISILSIKQINILSLIQQIYYTNLCAIVILSSLSEGKNVTWMISKHSRKMFSTRMQHRIPQEGKRRRRDRDCSEIPFSLDETGTFGKWKKKSNVYQKPENSAVPYKKHFS